MFKPLITLAFLGSIVGCTNHSAHERMSAVPDQSCISLLEPDLYAEGAQPTSKDVVRYGRYTLVSTQPESGQKDLMAQIVEINIPSNMTPTVHEAMLYVMNRSGYELCDPESGHVNILYTRPLPAAQYKMGPISLRNALQVLAGPAWQVEVNEVTRQVCYIQRERSTG